MEVPENIDLETFINSGQYKSVSAKPCNDGEKPIPSTSISSSLPAIELLPDKPQERSINAVKYPDGEQISSPIPIAVQPEPAVEQPVYTTSAESTDGKRYAGDYSEQYATPENGYEAMAFTSPAQVLGFFNEEIQSGQVNMHKWQAEVNLDLACVGQPKPTSLHPLKYYLVAANGSGKDAFVIAPFAIWFILAKVRSRCIITSSSGTQLTAQTENYIKSLAEKVNTKLGFQMFKIRQRYIYCTKSGSEIRMFATDEAGKAEGYHPLEPNAEMAIIKNESKSIPEEIHKALKRCSGFNYWLEISSPGAPHGAFYRATNTWKHGRRITSYDCPHISEEERNEDKIDLGESSAEYRSKHLALFTSVDGESVITSAIFDNALHNPPSFSFPAWPKRVGIDLAAGCDETCVTITQGTKVVSEYPFAEKDTTITVGKINDHLLRQGISKDSEHIYADDGGIGHAIIDNLVKLGWKIKRVLNQSVAFNKKQYGNKGAELWFRAKRFLEERVIDVTTLSQKTRDQLVNRRYKQPAGGRLFLQPKREAKAEGFPSPDRADALILSWTGLTIADFLGDGATETKKEAPRIRLVTPQAVEDYYDDITFGQTEMITSSNRSGHKARGSLQVALGLTNDKKGKFNELE